ncbi:helix-turn-helix domain-containing protein [Streptomyces sp. NPDC056716]|uniref:helix-turn-helix domain-containing protein n=1 Tax=unclassified Streptomyces TaxID=2593676 RepID=UPI0036B63329
MTFEPEQLGQSSQELASKLRELRKQAGLSGVRLAVRCNMPQSKISRFETGKARPSIVDVEQILRAVEAPPELVAQVSDLARMAHTEWQDIRSLRRKGLDKKQQELAGLESSTTEFRFFLLSMLTGLLSTPEYIRASLAHSPVDTTKTVAKKLERQQVLFDTSKRFMFILTEQAVRWPLVGAPEMAMQIDRLVSLSRLANIRLGVIPISGRIPIAPMDTFTIYDDTLATSENTAGVTAFRDPRDIAAYMELFGTLESYALFEEEARAQLGEWASHYLSR